MTAVLTKLVEPGCGLWKRVAETLAKLKVPPRRVEHLVAGDNPALLVDLLKELLEKQP